MIQLPALVLNTKYIYLLVAGLLAIGGITVAEVTHQGDPVTTIFQSSESGYRNVVISHADEVENAVNNMIAGRETPDTVMKIIAVQYRGTQRDSKLSAEDTTVNENYKAFLEAAYQVAQDAQAGNTQDLTAMKAAKAKLS